MSRTILLTPKELASAIGASESALRRWVDKGSIRMSRTAGGHRRIPLQEAIRFIREAGATVVRPELLGLGNLPGPRAGFDGVDAELFEALKNGTREIVRGLIVGAYVDGQSLTELFDGPIRSAMDQIGQLWKHDPRGIMIEHRATEICLEAIAELRGLLPLPHDQAPIAVGGAPQADPYQLPTMMAATVLAELGFRDINFGPNTPLELLGHEAITHGARLVWVSLSTDPQDQELGQSVQKMAELLAGKPIDLILGGRFAEKFAPPAAAKLVTIVNSMTALATFSRPLIPAPT